MSRFTRNCKFAKLTQHNMQYIPCNGALLAQETLFLTKKKHFFCPKISKNATNLNIAAGKRILGLKLFVQV